MPICTIFTIENGLITKDFTYFDNFEESGKGESSAIAFAIEQKDCLLIIDDYKGRKYAEQLGIKITGTLGVIIDAKLSGHLESVRPLLERIKMTDFRLTPELERRTLEKSGEV